MKNRVVSLRLSLFAAAVVASACASAPGQTLSIRVDSEGALLIGAEGPPETRYVLQGSGDMLQWEDLDDAVWSQSSHRIEEPGGPMRFYRLAPWTPPAGPITVVLTGDSTVADFTSNLSHFHGWGQGMYGYFKPTARVVNLAMPGQSSKSFMSSAEHAQMVALRPEYVLIQFGLIDEFGSLPTHTTTLPEFAEYLGMIVRDIREFGGVPILLTPPARKLFDATGKLIPIYQDRFAVIRNVATELDVHFIDLNQLSSDFVNGLGESGSEYIWWPGNYLHFSEAGAEAFAGLVVRALPASLRAHVVESGETPAQP
ncbi:MAG: hypothetical protein KF833_01100 [Verrucomicrobiae bacterium]|nr:hypothetical protein [Verrucomicrobiae bacterium]